MTRTLNEIYRICQQAAEGAGAPAGLDIEVARHSVWLAARQFQVLASLATQLEGTDGVPPVFSAAEINGSSLPASGRAGALLAPGLVDLLVARAAEHHGRIAASGLSTPLFLLPAALAYGVVGWHMRFRLHDESGTEFALEVDPAGARILGRPGASVASLGDGREFDIAADCAAGAEPRSVTPELEVLVTNAALTRRAERSQANGVEVDNAAWQRLAVLASRVLVPASDLSRQRGAGSSASDNE